MAPYFLIYPNPYTLLQLQFAAVNEAFLYQLTSSHHIQHRTATLNCPSQVLGQGLVLTVGLRCFKNLPMRVEPILSVCFATVFYSRLQ